MMRFIISGVFLQRYGNESEMYAITTARVVFDDADNGARQQSLYYIFLIIVLWQLRNCHTISRVEKVCWRIKTDLIVPKFWNNDIKRDSCRAGPRNTSDEHFDN